MSESRFSLEDSLEFPPCTEGPMRVNRGLPWWLLGLELFLGSFLVSKDLSWFEVLESLMDKDREIRYI